MIPNILKSKRIEVYSDGLNLIAELTSRDDKVFQLTSRFPLHIACKDPDTGEEAYCMITASCTAKPKTDINRWLDGKYEGEPV